MNRYLNIGCACAAVALIGMAGELLSAQQPQQPEGRTIGSNTPGPPDAVPATVTAVGTVRIGKAVKADGQALPVGNYQMRVTEREASPAAAGATPQYERWAEFLQGGQVKGREVVIIVTPSAAKQVLKDKWPAAGGYRADVLKGGDYYRVWFNKGGTHYLVHFNLG